MVSAIIAACEGPRPFTHSFSGTARMLVSWGVEARGESVATLSSNIS
jgi:hypothetical protein